MDAKRGNASGARQGGGGGGYHASKTSVAVSWSNKTLIQMMTE